MALGQADLLPSYYRVTYGSRVNFMFDGEIENPWNLLSGRFDLAFVITYLLPLLILASSYNLLSAEREHGTLRLLLSQPLSVRTLVLGKVVTRVCALLGTLVVVPVLVLLLTRPETRGGDLASLGMWAMLVGAYGLFWLGLAVAVNAYGRSSAANALVLVGAWVLFVLVVPMLLNLGVGIVRSAPSRTELATRTRLMTIDGLNRYNALLGTDYRYTQQPAALLTRVAVDRSPSDSTRGDERSLPCRILLTHRRALGLSARRSSACSARWRSRSGSVREAVTPLRRIWTAVIEAARSRPSRRRPFGRCLLPG